MKKNTSLVNSSKKFTNHSARKSTVNLLRKAKFPKCEIKNITGHSTEKGLDPYDSGDDEDLLAMSLAIHPDEIISNVHRNNSNSSSSSSSTTPRSDFAPILPISAPKQQQLNLYEKLKYQQMKLTQQFNMTRFYAEF